MAAYTLTVTRNGNDTVFPYADKWQAIADGLKLAEMPCSIEGTVREGDKVIAWFAHSPNVGRGEKWRM